MAADSQFQLGVLLVHGIGTQPSGDTLVRWGDVLMKTIGRATQNQVVASVEQAGPNPRLGEERAEATVRLGWDDRVEHWLLSEGWWAKSFPSPSYRELMSWSVRALPWSIATHIARRYWQAAQRKQRRAKLVDLAIALGQLIVTLALTPLFIMLLGLLLLLGLLPIPQLRTLILAAQSTLTATVGDSLAFVESPVRAALMRTRILDGLKQLKQRCERTVILAHSQGAAVVLDSLGGIVKLVYEGKATSEEKTSSSRAVPDTLVTFGAGTNQLAAQKVLSDGLTKKLGRNPAYIAVGAIVMAALFCVWLYYIVRFNQTTFPKILMAIGVWLLVCAIPSALVWAINRLSRKRQIPRERSNRIIFWTVIPVLFVTFGLGFWYGEHENLPLFPIGILFLALMMLASSMHTILSREVQMLVNEPVSKPEGLGRWVDLYASADPVPNGPTWTAEPNVPEPVPVWNLGSMFADHTTYWDNLDGFVLRVVRECTETAQSPWKEKLPPETRYVDDRAAWRVSFLRLARWSTGLIWLFLGVFIWGRHRQRIPLPFDLPSWLPPMAALAVRFAVLAGLITLAAWASARILRWIWRWWVRSEQLVVLTHGQPRGNARKPLTLMGMFVWLVLLLALGLVRASVPDANALDINLGEWWSVPFMLLGLAWPSTFLLLKLKPPPQVSEPSDGKSTH